MAEGDSSLRYQDVLIRTIVSYQGGETLVIVDLLFTPRQAHASIKLTQCCALLRIRSLRPGTQIQKWTSTNLDSND